jgi:threonine/homoserine/homoserine lactone efflux protein
VIIDPKSLTLFILAVLALMISPGPDMLFIMANGIAQGPKAGAVSALGVGVGGLILTMAAAFGVAALVATHPVAFDALRYGGAAYLMWIAYKTARSDGAFTVPGAAPAVPMKSLFVRGIVTNVLNPKAVIFFMAFLPQFADPARGLMLLQLLFLGLLLTAIGTSINTCIGLGSGKLGALLTQSPRLAKAQKWFLIAIFLILAVRLVWRG